MVFDVSRVLSVFETCAKFYTDYLKQSTRQKENAYKSMVEQWGVEDVDLIKNKIIVYDPSHKIEKELTGDAPDKNKLQLRLEWAYKRLGMPGEDDSYFPRWDKENYAIPNKDGYGNKSMYDALTAAKGERYAFDVMCRLETIVEWANIKISDVEALLDDLCKWVGYSPKERQNQQQKGEGNSGSVDVPDAKQAAGKQDISPKPARGRGRPKETLKDKMINDADGSKLQKIHTLIQGKKGKDADLILLASVLKGWMNRPTHTEVMNEFGDIGSKTGYNRYFHKEKFTNEEIEGAIRSLD